jgi:hypothetical protein
MTPAEAAAMADPDRNPHFRRRRHESRANHPSTAPDQRRARSDVRAELSADLRSARLVRPDGGTPRLEEVR